MRRRDVSLLLAALPVAASYISTVLSQSIDLLLLSHYSGDALAAVFPGFIVCWNLMMFFVGFAKYIRILMGEEMALRGPYAVGRTVWLGMLVALAAGCVFLALSRASGPLFRSIAHPPQVRQLEIIYFTISCYCVPWQIAKVVFEQFYIAVGRQMTVLWTNAISLAVNTILAVVLIFGAYGAPRLGIAGAAYATLAATAITVLAYCVPAGLDPTLRPYSLLSLPRPNWRLLGKFMRKGVPCGVETFVEELTWTVLILAIGRLGSFALALSNVAVNILELAYLPVVGVGEIISLQIARSSANLDSIEARRLARLALGATLIYGALWSIALASSSATIRALYFSAPEFQGADSNQTFSHYFAILEACTFCGPFYYTCSAILTGKGDTAFSMMAFVLTTVCLFCFPLYAVIRYDLPFLWGWLFFGVNLATAALIAGVRCSWADRVPTPILQAKPTGSSGT